MNGLENEYKNTQLTFVRLDANVSENAALQKSYGLRGHPTVAIVASNGDVIKTFIGAQSAEILRPALDSVVKNP